MRPTYAIVFITFDPDIIITFSSCKVQENLTSFRRLRESNQIVPLIGFEKQILNFKSLFTLFLKSEKLKKK